MKFFIPTLGTKFRLNQDWTFPIAYESRNEKLITRLGYDEPVFGNMLQNLTDLIKANRDIIDKIPFHTREKMSNTDYVLTCGNFMRYYKNSTNSAKFKEILRYINILIQLSTCSLTTAVLETIRDEFAIRATLPINTELEVDRIYIRKNMKDFDSVTFYVRDCPGNPALCPPLKKQGFNSNATRFWVNLDSINGIDVIFN